jgi:hypothetical protein
MFQLIQNPLLSTCGHRVHKLSFTPKHNIKKTSALTSGHRVQKLRLSFHISEINAFIDDRILLYCKLGTVS